MLTLPVSYVICYIQTHMKPLTRLVSFAGPLPMEDIAKMADECLRDVDEDEDDGNLEDDQDLLVFVPKLLTTLKIQNSFFMYESKWTK